MAERYATLSRDNPDLARNVSAADADEVRRWHASDCLHAVTVAGVVAGLLAVAPGQVQWIDGYEMDEEVTLAPHSGNGYAASAQAAWAHRAGIDPAALLVGTIDRLNTA